MSRVQKIISKTVKINISKEEIAGEVKRFFHERSYLYVVMDYGVGMGLYENGNFQIRMESEKSLSPFHGSTYRNWRFLINVRNLGLGMFRIGSAEGIV